jgi:hypothetical protein
MPKQIFYYGNRRQFLKSSLLVAGTAAVSAPSILRAAGANERINIACIGVGGKGDSDTNSAFGLGGNIVALCDIDSNTLNGKDKALKASGATCATLQACCDKLAGSAKTGCESAKNAASGSDATCGGIYDALYKAQCP